MRQSENYGQIEERSWDCQGLKWAVLSEKTKKSVKYFHWINGSTVMKLQYCTFQSQQLGIVLQVMSFVQVALFGLFDVIMQRTSLLNPGMCRRMKCGFMCTKSSNTCKCHVVHSSPAMSAHCSYPNNAASYPSLYCCLQTDSMTSKLHHDINLSVKCCLSFSIGWLIIKLWHEMESAIVICRVHSPTKALFYLKKTH